MTNIFDVLTEKYDAWYDSEEGKALYKSELLCLKPLVENCLTPILEIGVGTGRFAGLFPGTFGIDPSLKALEIAKKRGVKIFHGVGEQLPFPDKYFGCVMIIFTLCFVQRPIDVLREAKRVLQENGSVLIGMVPKDSHWGVLYQKKKKDGNPFYSAATFYSFEEVEKLSRKAGLVIKMIRSTLIQRPEDKRRIEEPVEGFIEGAGFLCIEMKKKKEFFK